MSHQDVRDAVAGCLISQLAGNRSDAVAEIVERYAWARLSDLELHRLHRYLRGAQV